jgi:pimeloyl-ACP methyl ester carboxylesterase
MGRSLGSISVLELAYHYPESIKGLIIESGFISVIKLIKHLGLPAGTLDLTKIEEECYDRASKISLPTLIIHGKNDTLVPFTQAEELLQFLGAKNKQLIAIPHAEHNNIMIVAIEKYFTAIKDFVSST